MLEIATGVVRAYYLLDVADTIDLAAMGADAAKGLAPAEFPLRPHTSPAYLQFPLPPLAGRLPEATIGDLHCDVRVKYFDYGVISLRLTFDAKGTWDELVALAERVRTDERIAQYAADTGMRLCDEIASALDDRHAPLIEDYFILEIDSFTQPVDAGTLLGEHFACFGGVAFGRTRSGCLRPSRLGSAAHALFVSRGRFDDRAVGYGVRLRPPRKRARHRRHSRVCQLAADRTAYLRRTPRPGTRRHLQTASGQPGRALSGRRESEQAASLRYSLVDVLELIDRSSNALKVVGDAYYARIYRAAAKRLGLADWQRQIDTNSRASATSTAS